MAIQIEEQQMITHGVAQGFQRPTIRSQMATRDIPMGKVAAKAEVAVATPSKANLALSGLYLLVGYQWLVSGVDKVLYGRFPSEIGGLLQGQVTDARLPGAFHDLLRTLVLPNAATFGTLIMWAETLAGVGLLTAGIVTLLRPLIERHMVGVGTRVFGIGFRLLDILTPLAALGTLALGISYYVLDGMPTPAFTPSVAYGGALDSGLFLALGSVVLLIGQLGQRLGRNSR